MSPLRLRRAADWVGNPADKPAAGQAFRVHADGVVLEIGVEAKNIFPAAEG